MVIDIHAHVFPERIAERASESISAFYDVSARHTGCVTELLKCMAEGGIDRALIHSVALSPSRVTAINDFIAASAMEYPDRLTGYAALHPDMTENEVCDELARAVRMGLRGVKLHSDMQGIAIDDPRMDKIYAACQDTCPLLLHMGDRRYHYDNPAQLPGVLRRFPRLRVIGAHMGGYSEWEEARQYLQHENVLVDCSSSCFCLGEKGLLDCIRFFGADRVLFGTDFPMWDPAGELRRLRGLGLAGDELDRILHRNAEEYLGL